MDVKVSDLAQLIPLEYHRSNEERSLHANSHLMEPTSSLNQLIDRCLIQLDVVDRFIQVGLADSIGLRCA